MQTLFDKEGLLNISDIVLNHPSYISIMEDGFVSDTELKEQAEATVASLRKLQNLCNEEQQSAILDSISELSVLFAAYHHHQLQNLR
ncbi:MAG: hypothetical protein K2H87_09590 [Duncaniella sp.]|nr:hypothetical protein [Duncaniella sp.]